MHLAGNECKICASTMGAIHGSGHHNLANISILGFTGITVASVAAIVGIAFAASNYFVHAVERMDKPRENHALNLASLFEAIGSARIPEVERVSDYELGSRWRYLDWALLLPEYDPYNELQQHLENGYSELHRRFFNEFGIKDKIDNFNAELSNVIKRINEKFVYDISKFENMQLNLRIHSLLNEHLSCPFFPIVRVDETGTPTIIDSNRQVILQHSDSKKVRAFADLIEKEFPEFAKELKDLLRTKATILEEYMKFQSELRATARQLRQDYNFKGRCENCP